ncbi:hypothetical protein IEQ34_017281 [Dendrobium chrysotoxum]|uniref:Uncharacterized protein n=1 Tax=Dendrobium chrysotoxum TaxID=161865 RepID=A0AAV7GBL1_DENCH|nr:hypothetical protein IEQ34_017281 [Dendrobium chrysotoxum]
MEDFPSFCEYCKTLVSNKEPLGKMFAINLILNSEANIKMNQIIIRLSILVTWEYFPLINSCVYILLVQVIVVVPIELYVDLRVWNCHYTFN